MFGRKEKSVLQSKLTKLAIQIGYAGRSVIFCLIADYCIEYIMMLILVLVRLFFVTYY